MGEMPIPLEISPGGNTVGMIPSTTSSEPACGDQLIIKKESSLSLPRDAQTTGSVLPSDWSSTDPHHEINGAAFDFDDVSKYYSYV